MLFKKLSAVAVAALLLTGCTPAEDEFATFSENPEARAFEEGAQNTQTGESKTQAPVEAPLIESSSGSIGGKVEIQKAKEMINAAVFYVEENKTEAGYDEWLYYQTGPKSTIRLKFLPSLSSPKSYCMLATSTMDPDMGMLYDSQQKKILADGASCKTPSGTPWETLESENLETTNTATP